MQPVGMRSCPGPGTCHCLGSLLPCCSGWGGQRIAGAYDDPAGVSQGTQYRWHFRVGVPAATVDVDQHRMWPGGVRPVDLNRLPLARCVMQDLIWWRGHRGRVQSAEGIDRPASVPHGHRGGHTHGQGQHETDRGEHGCDTTGSLGVPPQPSHCQCDKGGDDAPRCCG